jgi:hypothetical protein
MYTRRSLVLGLLAAGLLAAQQAPPTIGVSGAGYEDVWLHEVLKMAGVPQGSQLRAARSVRMLTEFEVVQLRK